MTKNILELGIYVAIISLLLGLVALINTLITDVGATNSQNLETTTQRQEQLQN